MADHRNEATHRALHVPQGHVLFRPADACAGFVVVHSGTVRVSLVSAGGREIVLYRVRPGDICLQTFGCLVNAETYSAEGVAETDLEIEIIPAGEFHRRVGEDSHFRQQLFSAVATRFSDLERLVEDVALSSLEVRLARALLRLMDRSNHVAATHETLAVEIGSARAVVSRQMSAFARQGLVGSSRGHIEVLSPGALKAIAQAEEYSAPW